MELSWLLPKDIIEFSAIMLIALILDYIYPFHKGVMYRIHPVHTAYFMSLKLYKLLPKTRTAGVMIWFVVVLVHISIYAFVLYLLNIMNRVLWILASAYVLKVSLSLKLLVDHVYSTGLCLKNGDIVCARNAIAGAVRRDVSTLGEGHIASAAIETLFENLVDGFTSPLLYYLILGPLGALFQRLVNTLDAALGYKVGDFIEVGWFSARVDDVVNYVPARLTMFLMIALCSTIGGSPRDSIRAYLRYGATIESINARTVITSIAGCIHVRLEKIGFYSVGNEHDLPSVHDVFKAIRLSLYVSSLYIILLHLIFLLLYKLIWVSI